MRKKIKIDSEDILCDLCGDNDAEEYKVGEITMDLCYGHKGLPSVLFSLETVFKEKTARVFQKAVDGIAVAKAQTLLTEIIELSKTDE